MRVDEIISVFVRKMSFIAGNKMINRSKVFHGNF